MAGKAESKVNETSLCSLISVFDPGFGVAVLNRLRTSGTDDDAISITSSLFRLVVWKTTGVECVGTIY